MTYPKLIKECYLAQYVNYKRKQSEKIPLIFKVGITLPGYTLQIGIFSVSKKSAEIAYISAKS